LDVFQQLLHQFVVVIRQRFQHGEPRSLLAVERIALEGHDFRWGVLLVDKRAFEREIDEASNNIAGKSRDLSQQQLAARGGLQELQRVMNARISLVDLVEKQKVRNFLFF